MGNNTEDKEKCFVIMPISDQGDYPKGHFTKVYEQIIKPAVEDAGYIPYRVDENKISDTIINKIFDAIQECPMAICDLSNRNPNVLYELGLRQAYDKPVVLIQDNKTEDIFDVSGISTIYYQSERLYEDVIEARNDITDAILSTKNKKINTLVRIVKAKTPDLSNIDISQDDKIKMMLDGIYREIKQIDMNRKVDIQYVPDTYMGKIVAYEDMYDKCHSDEEISMNNYEELLDKVSLAQEEIRSEKLITNSDRNYLLQRLDALKQRLQNNVKK